MLQSRAKASPSAGGSRLVELNAPARLRLNRNVLLPALFFISPLATSVAPRLTPFMIAVIGVTLIVAGSRRGLAWHELAPRRSGLAVSLLFGAYVFLSATWSADPIAGLGKAASLVALILMSFASLRAMAALEKGVLRQAAIAFAAGACLGAFFLAFELLTDALATRTAMNVIPILQSASPKHVKISGGEVVALNLSKLDQNVNLALFHLWPGLLALMGLKNTRRTLAMGLFFVAVTAAIAVSEHDSSQVALIGSSLTVLLAFRWRQLVSRALVVLWCAAFIFVIPASFIAYQSGLHHAGWLPDSARARIILWRYTAEQTLERPVLGVGVDSTPTLSKQQKAAGRRDQPEGFVFPRTMGHHAHSMFLQAWYELGLVGALLFAIAGAALVMLIFSFPASAQPFAYGAFAAFALVGAFAWGMWQSWFMCAVALLPVYLRAAAASPEAASPASGLASLT